MYLSCEHQWCCNKDSAYPYSTLVAFQAERALSPKLVVYPAVYVWRAPRREGMFSSAYQEQVRLRVCMLRLSSAEGAFYIVTQQMSASFLAATLRRLNPYVAVARHRDWSEIRTVLIRHDLELIGHPTHIRASGNDDDRSGVSRICVGKSTARRQNIADCLCRAGYDWLRSSPHLM